MILADKKEEILELINELPVSFHEEILKVLKDFKAKKEDADSLKNFDRVVSENREVLQKLAQ